jgi:hypothetical protein
VPESETERMSMKTHHGGCHCGKVRFEADFDVEAGSGKCNCSICIKARLWSIRVKPENFRLLTAESELTNYQFNTNSVHHLFCKHCGVRSFEWSDIPQAGGKAYSVMVTCLDDLDMGALLAAPIKFYDGLHNNWWSEPTDTRHL